MRKSALPRGSPKRPKSSEFCGPNHANRQSSPSDCCRRFISFQLAPQLSTSVETEQNRLKGIKPSAHYQPTTVKWGGRHESQILTSTSFPGSTSPTTSIDVPSNSAQLPRVDDAHFSVNGFSATAENQAKPLPQIISTGSAGTVQPPPTHFVLGRTPQRHRIITGRHDAMSCIEFCMSKILRLVGWMSCPIEPADMKAC